MLFERICTAVSVASEWVGSACRQAPSHADVKIYKGHSEMIGTRGLQAER